MILRSFKHDCFKIVLLCIIFVFGHCVLKANTYIILLCYLEQKGKHDLSLKQVSIVKKNNELNIFRIFSSKVLSGNSSLFTEREQWKQNIFQT